MPHSINHGDACFAYFNKIWGIPAEAMEAFKKTSQSAWRKSARNSRRAHR
jgi:hypothetical protein